MSYSAAIGDMLLSVGGSGIIVGLFLLGAFAFLCYKRGYDTLLTAMVIYPTLVGLLSDPTGKWIPLVVQGIALLGVGILLGLAINKLFGQAVGEGSDIFKIFIIVMCWNSLFLLLGYTGAQLESNATLFGSVTNLFTNILNFITGGNIINFFTYAGVDAVYVTVLRVPIILVTGLAGMFFVMKIVSVVAQVGVKGAVAIALVIGTVGGGFLLASLMGFF